MAQCVCVCAGDSERDSETSYLQSQTLCSSAMNYNVEIVQLQVYSFQVSIQQMHQRCWSEH